MNNVKSKVEAMRQWLAGSFESGPHGASARKLTAFACILFAGYCHQFITKETASTFLVIDLSGNLVALGIVTMQQIIRLKNGGSATNEKSNGSE